MDFFVFISQSQVDPPPEKFPESLHDSLSLQDTSGLSSVSEDVCGDGRSSQSQAGPDRKQTEPGAKRG